MFTASLYHTIPLEAKTWTNDFLNLVTKEGVAEVVKEVVVYDLVPPIPSSGYKYKYDILPADWVERYDESLKAKQRIEALLARVEVVHFDKGFVAQLADVAVATAGNDITVDAGGLGGGGGEHNSNATSGSIDVDVSDNASASTYANANTNTNAKRNEHDQSVATTVLLLTRLLSPTTLCIDGRSITSYWNQEHRRVSKIWQPLSSFWHKVSHIHLTGFVDFVAGFEDAKMDCGVDYATLVDEIDRPLHRSLEPLGVTCCTGRDYLNYHNCPDRTRQVVITNAKEAQYKKIVRMLGEGYRPEKSENSEILGVSTPGERCRSESGEVLSDS